MRKSSATTQTTRSGGSQIESKATEVKSRGESLLDFVVVSLACALFLAISLYQLDLPGLYTDEAYDVIPAMQMVLGHQVELQGGVLALGDLRLPLMSSSAYQGVTYTYLALPFFAIGGVNVISLRLMTVLVGAIGVALTYFLGRAWFGRDVGRIAALLLALSPSWIFWSRLGVYVVSVVAPIAMGALLAFTYWVRAHPRAGYWRFYLGMFLLGVGLTTKLLFLWFITALILCSLILWGRHLWQHLAMIRKSVGVRARVLLLGALAFCLGAFPFILYNILTQGTVNLLRQTLSGPSTTTHGVDNTAFVRNLWTEVDAFKVMLDGGYFWFQGVNQQPYANPVAPAIFALSAIGLLALVLGQRAKDEGWRTENAGSSFLLRPPSMLLIGALILSLVIAVFAPVGVVGMILMLSTIALVLVGAGVLIWQAVREQVSTIPVAWLLLSVLIVAGSFWWFFGGGRPEGRAVGTFLGLWPVDMAGIVFLVTGTALMIVLGADRKPSPMQRPAVAALSLIGLIVVQSTVTVSGLWPTHLLIALPLPQLVIAALMVEGTRLLVRRISRWAGRDKSRSSAQSSVGARVIAPLRKTLLALPATLLLSAMLVGDAVVDAIYHRDLSAAGGASTFSDAIYSLNNYLQTDKAGYKVVAMDWGFRRPLQFLSHELITPIEGYGLTAEPPPEFYTSLRQFLQDEKTVYLFHTEMGTAYHRRDAFLKEVATAGKEAVPDATFKHRDGMPVYELYTVR